MGANLKAIFELFTTAITSNLKYPKVTLQTPKGQHIEIKLAGAKSRYTGQLMITNGAGYNSARNLYFGRIDLAGKYQQSTFHPEMATLLERFAADPAGVAAEYGKLTGNCCFCQLKLTDPQSLAVGYGPICADHWGLPHGKAAMKASSKPVVPVVAPHDFAEGLDTEAEHLCDIAMAEAAAAENQINMQPRELSALDKWIAAEKVEVPSMSWKGEVVADSTGKWYDNAIRLATKDEAEGYVSDLFSRWTLATDKRVVESTDPVNYRWVPGKGLEAVSPAQSTQ